MVIVIYYYESSVIMLACISFLFGPLRSKEFTEKDGIPCRCYGRFNCIIGYTYFLFCEVHQVPALFFFFFFFINVFIHVIFMNVFVRNCTLINFVTTRNKVILIILIFLIYYYFFWPLGILLSCFTFFYCATS